MTTNVPRRFGIVLRCDAATCGGRRDTTRYELSDENAAVIVTTSKAISPEPVAGGLFCRVRRDDGRVVVGLIDLTGSSDGSWLSGTSPGTCRSAELSTCRVARSMASTSGRARDQRRPLRYAVTHEVADREGQAIAVRVPLETGWSILRLQNAGAIT